MVGLIANVLSIPIIVDVDNCVSGKFAPLVMLMEEINALFSLCRVCELQYVSI